MNTLKLRFLLGYEETYEEDAAVLHSLLTVDGHRLDDEETDMLHLDELVGSIYGYGYFEIYTCSCGVAQCADIWEDILVDQEGNTILWTVPQPLRPLEDGQTEHKHFVFDREHYRQAIQTGLDEAKKLVRGHPGEISIGPSDFTVENLLQLSTEMPKVIPDRRPGKREIFVHHGPVLVENSYICRIVKEERSETCTGFWVEAWTGTMWTRDMEPSTGVNTVKYLPPVSLSILAEAGVPAEPFPPGYQLPELEKNRWGI